MAHFWLLTLCIEQHLADNKGLHLFYEHASSSATYVHPQICILTPCKKAHSLHGYEVIGVCEGDYQDLTSYENLEQHLVIETITNPNHDKSKEYLIITEHSLMSHKMGFVLGKMRADNPDQSEMREKDIISAILKISQSKVYRFGFYGVANYSLFEIIALTPLHYGLRGGADTVPLFVNNIRLVYHKWVVIDQCLLVLIRILPLEGGRFKIMHESKASANKPIKQSLTGTKWHQVLDQIEKVISSVTNEIKGDSIMANSCRYFCMSYLFYAKSVDKAILFLKKDTKAIKYGDACIETFIEESQRDYDIIVKHCWFFIKPTTVTILITSPLAYKQLKYYNYINGTEYTVADMDDNMTEAFVALVKSHLANSDKGKDQLITVLESLIIQLFGAKKYNLARFSHSAGAAPDYREYKSANLEWFDDKCTQMYTDIQSGKNGPFDKFKLDGKGKKIEKLILENLKESNDDGEAFDWQQFEAIQLKLDAEKEKRKQKGNRSNSNRNRNSNNSNNSNVSILQRGRGVKTVVC